MLELDCPCVTPEIVLKASGHIDKFTDLMVKDEKTGTCFHADHLLKDFCKEKLKKDLSMPAEKATELKHILAVVDDLSAEELGAKIKEYSITAPDTKNPFSDPYPFNLMFQTPIGLSGMQVLVGQMYYSGYGVPRDAQKGRAWITRASKSRSSVWKVNEKHPGYIASDSDSDELEVDAK